MSTRPPVVILEISKYRGRTAIASIRRNFREPAVPVPLVDKSRSNENIQLISIRSAEESISLLQTRVKPCVRRSTSVELLKYEVTASVGAFVQGSRLAHDRGQAYFGDALVWLSDIHGLENIIFATVHVDYINRDPRLSVGVVPRLDGSEGPRLAASHWIAGRDSLSELNTQLARIGERYGLARGRQRSNASRT